MKRLLFLVLLLSLIAASIHAQAEPVELKIMTFNVWRGGDLVNFDSVIAAIQAADADIVGLQEPTGNTRLIAERLGWHYASITQHVISRYPLIELPEAQGGYVLVELAPGQVVALANVHLPADPYGPYDARDGATVEQVLNLEQATRVPVIQPVLQGLQPLIGQGYPVLLTGDFSTPSHRDWTEAAVQARGLPYPVAWPVTQAIEAIGMIDTFRAVYPDPVANPGITMIDRMDMIFASSNVEVLNSQIVGAGDSPETSIGIDPYPSDHRAVVSTVRLTPVEPPVFAVPDRASVEQGDTLTVRYHAPNGEGVDRISIAAQSGQVMAWLPPYEAGFFGSVSFGTGTLEPGEYTILLNGEGGSLLSRSSFWVIARGAVPLLMTDKTAYAPGEMIYVRWENAPGSRLDWLGIYGMDDPDLYNGFLGFAYTQSAVHGEIALDPAAFGELPPGIYEIRLMLDDSYIVLASVDFTVSAP